MTKKFKVMIDGQLQTPKQIDFKVMGLNEITSDFLNWAMENRINLEFLKECKTFERVATSTVIHLDHCGVIKRVDDAVIHTRA